jgi:hypothetical protein
MGRTALRPGAGAAVLLGSSALNIAADGGAGRQNGSYTPNGQHPVRRPPARHGSAFLSF